MLTEIRLDGFAQLGAAWDKAPQATSEELEKFMHAATIYLEGEIKDRTPSSGHATLRNSFTSDVEILADSVIGMVGSPLSYAAPVELGTRPHFPPVDAIMDWVKVKLGIAEPEARGVAFAIARKIAAHGTQGAFMVQNALEASRPELERLARITMDAIADRLAGAGA